MQLPLWRCLIGGEVGVNVEFLLIINGVCVCRRVLLLAAAVRQHVLPPRRSASLHDPADDERTLESQGKWAWLARSWHRFRPPINIYHLMWEYRLTCLPFKHTQFNINCTFYI